MDADIRARAREAMRAELAEAIMAVFIARGFEETTADEAATAVGISRATFFRYFAGKEDVVVAAVDRGMPDFPRILREFAEVAGDEGSTPSQPTLWEFARAAIQPEILDAAADRARRRERLRLIGDHPALRARFVQRRETKVAALAEALAAYAPGGEAAARSAALVVAAAAMSTLDVAWRRWVESDDAELIPEVDAAFAALAAAARA